MSAENGVIVLIPAFNEAASISTVIQAVKPYGAPLVVDDGSTDNTAALAEAAGAKVLRLPENCGYEGALDRGFQAASKSDAKVVVTFDADGQFVPTIITELSQPILNGETDLVLGKRPKSARLGEAIFNLYTRIRFGVTDILCGAKGYAMPVYRRHGRFDSGRSIATELALSALRSGSRYAVVPVEVLPRQHGKPRFGSGLRANCRILYALWLALLGDFGPAPGERPQS